MVRENMEAFKDALKADLGGNDFWYVPEQCPRPTTTTCYHHYVVCA
jgi:hypothetical protein